MAGSNRISVRVGDDEIKVATQRDKGHCAVAVALATEYPDARSIKVDRNKISFSDVRTRRRYTYETPRQVQRFIDEFDQGLPVKPVSLVLTDDVLTHNKPMQSRSPSQVAKPKPQWVPPTDRPARKLNERRINVA